MGYLDLSNIWERALPSADVEIPEWEGTVRVRAVTVSELARAKRLSTNPKTHEEDALKMMAIIAVSTCIEPQFAPGMETALANKEAGAVSKIAERALELSGIQTEPIRCTCPDCGRKFAVDDDGKVTDLGEA